MTTSSETLVRAFDGSLADADGVLRVERATFDESPYNAQQVRAMLTDGPQRAWLAIGGDHVVGFAIAFLTTGLRGLCWEIDLLAVLPAWRGRRLATRLVRAAAACGAHVARQARAVVADDNTASMRAFSRVGFRVEPELCELLICRAGDLPPGHWPAPGVTVRVAASATDSAGWLADPLVRHATDLASSHSVLPGDLAPIGQEPGDVGLLSRDGLSHLTLLLAEQDGQPAGYAELVEVQTLLYRGVWLESLVASERRVREVLVREAADRAKAAGLDEIGALVPESNKGLQRALLAAGFRSLGDYRWLTSELPLPDSTFPPRAGGTEGKQQGDARV